jgi:hypothetical protein
MIRKLLTVAAIAMLGVTASAGQAAAGSIYLTGHDVLLHSGQNDYDNIILDYLRGAGTATEIAAGDYDILLLRGFTGGVGTVGVTTLEGFGTITTIDIETLTDDAALLAAAAGKDVIVIPDHTSCGGCDLTTADADILEARSAAFTAYFNAGGDLFVGSGASDTTFYNFLPPSAVASGLPIGGSSGFTATAAGVSIGILPNMINGFPTHNRFASFAPVFTVFETRGDEIISIGARDARIVDDVIVDTGTVPEPVTMALVGVGLAGFAASRRRRKA